MREQCAVSYEEQMAGWGICDPGVSRHDPLTDRRVDRAEIDAALVRQVAANEVQEPPAVGKNLWPAVPVFLPRAVERRDVAPLAAVRIDPVNARIGCKD